jgi:hypothetical protein
MIAALRALDALLVAGFKTLRLHIPDVARPGVPTPVLCETCAIIRPRITWAEWRALIALGDMHKPRQIACRTKGCTGHAKPLDLWEGQ